MPMETDVERFAKLRIVFAFVLALAVSGSKGQTAAPVDSQRKTAFALEQQGNYADAETA